MESRELQRRRQLMTNAAEALKKHINNPPQSAEYHNGWQPYIAEFKRLSA
jgi:hypothetical protein